MCECVCVCAFKDLFPSIIKADGDEAENELLLLLTRSAALLLATSLAWFSAFVLIIRGADQRLQKRKGQRRKKVLNPALVFYQ